LKTLLLILLCLIVITRVNSQLSVEPVWVGEKISDVALTFQCFKSVHGKLSDFKGKIILLDFWATWCSSCIHSFPKLDSLQKKFNGQLQILLVNTKHTRDDANKVKGFYSNWRMKYGKSLALPTVVEDIKLEKLFPHKSIPHYVWIGKDGIVKAITTSYEVTSENIQTIIQYGEINLPLKFDIDTDRPLFSGEYLPEDHMVYYSILLKGSIPGLASGGRIKKNGNTTNGVLLSNRPLLQLYQNVYSQLRPDLSWSTNSLFLEVHDSSELMFEKSTLSKDEWEHQNLYTLDLIVPDSEAQLLYKIILETLNLYSGYNCTIEKRKLKCLVLIRTSLKDKIGTKGGKIESRLFENANPYLTNTPISHLIGRIAYEEYIKLPVIDGTNYPGKIDIQLSSDFKDPELVKKELKKYDLDLIEEEREIEVFVITDKKK
jgi:thiol-disulfide isomerase/thioredoxin